MEYFVSGVLSIAFAIIFPQMYIIACQPHRVGAWSSRPGYHAWFFIIVAALFGLA